MNPYLSGIMALSQLSPEQFDTGMQRFQKIQGMQPQGLSALQARQSGLTGSMAGIPQGPAVNTGQAMGQPYRGEGRKPQHGVRVIDGVSMPYYESTVSNQSFAAPEGYQPRSSQPTMSPFSNTQGSFGTGAMPYTQPYYQRSFNPYAGGYGMGFGGGMPSYGGFGGGQQMYGGFGGGKGGGRPSYGGGKGGRGY